MKTIPTDWQYTPGTLNIWARSPLNARVRLATIHDFAPMNGIDSDGAAQLMAAAPDLLAALQRLMAYDFGNSEGAIQARAALEKAGCPWPL